MKTRDIKTIDVNAKEWFDKVNANSYFSAEITVNLGMKNEKTLTLPFSYGYGDSYRSDAFKAVKRELNCFRTMHKNTAPHRAYAKYKITARHSKKTGCLKKELIIA